MQRLVSTAATVAEAREKESACLTLFGKGGYRMALSGMWVDSHGNNVWDVAGSHMKVVAINRDYVVLNDSTDYGPIKVKPDPGASSWQKPEVRFYV